MLKYTFKNTKQIKLNKKTVEYDSKLFINKLIELTL